MKIYNELSFSGVSPEVADILIAELADAGYHGFLEEEGELKAYVDEQAFNEAVVEAISKRYDCRFVVNQIEEQNWNATWESSFSPVRVGSFAAIRADFHEVVKDVEYEIIITPKMSFGTGHHATTYLVMKAMNDMFGQGQALKGVDVLDFGTGTGVLAILASKMGAKQVVAVDNDSWSINNAGENIEMNGCGNIELSLAEELPTGKTFDLILANINKHILLDHCKAIVMALKPGGTVLLSGILSSDVPDIERAYELYLHNPVLVEERNNWMMMAFSKRHAG